MRIKYKPWAKDYIKENSDKFIQDYDHLVSLMDQYDDVILEIGCGKGQFSIEKAKQYPNSLYIAVERYDSVIVKAGEKLEHDNVENLFFFSQDIINMAKYEILQHRVKSIYLNFSDPWPKKRHSKRRLTSPTYLDIYSNLLVDDGSIYFKTDNQGLFEYSLISASTHGWGIVDICLDLHNSGRENIVTEYEEKFSKLGFRICYAEFQRNKQNQDNYEREN